MTPTTSPTATLSCRGCDGIAAVDDDRVDTRRAVTLPFLHEERPAPDAPDSRRQALRSSRLRVRAEARRVPRAGARPGAPLHARLAARTRLQTVADARN